MNELGAILLVVSASFLFFVICCSCLGLSLRQQSLLSRSLVLDLADRCSSRSSSRKGLKGRLSRYWTRSLLSIMNPLSSFLFRSFHLLPSKACRLAYLFLYLNFAVTSLALILLAVLMLSADMKNLYVVSHSSSSLSFFFRFTGIWAGSSGSLLLWYWLLSLFSAICVRQNLRHNQESLPVLCLILGAVQMIFVILLIFIQDAQPFRIYEVSMQAGRGINPLLLHWAMIIHPPILYLGYVSSALPFAVLMSALISGRIREKTFEILRFWIIFSWFFLGTGILLGSKWAYEELGWGGYWAWDPVENASLMPWLISTALLHSLIVQEKRNMLRFWNLFLVLLFYHMSMLGTWITRSGILEGPHTFANSSIGIPMITFIGMSAFYFFRFLYFFRNRLTPVRSMTSITSKEGSILLNNFVMLLSMLIILIGVFSPLLPLDCRFISGSGLECYRVEWKQGAYNRILIPVGLLTLFLMGASPLLAWQKNALTIWKKNLSRPLVLGILGGILFGSLYGFFFTLEEGYDLGIWGSKYVSEWISILVVGISIFVISGIVQEYAQGIHFRRSRFGESIPKALVKLIGSNRRRYGGYLVHLSIVFLFIGYSGSAFKKTEKFEFFYYRSDSSKATLDRKEGIVRYYSGDQAYLGNYEIQARDLFFRPVFYKRSDKTNPSDFIISQESHYHVRKGEGRRTPIRKSENTTSYEAANRPLSFWSQKLKFFTGYITDGRIRTERYFYPRIDPTSGRVIRNEKQHSLRTATSKPDILSSWNEDIYFQLGSLNASLASVSNERGVSTIPSPLSTPLNHSYELYYHFFDKKREAYLALFPPYLTATLEVWINPLVKFIWLGSSLFFLSGLLLLLPDRKRTKR